MSRILLALLVAVFALLLSGTAVAAGTSFSYDFTNCTIPDGVTYDYGSQSKDWKCNNTDTGGRYYANMPWSQGIESVDDRNPETYPIMYVQPENIYQNFNVTFTVAAYRNVYLGGSGSLESGFHNKGTIKIYAFDSSHIAGDMAYWEISIVPGNRISGTQHLTFTSRWVYGNQTLKSVTQDNSPNNAFLCDGSCAGSPPNRWINVRLERIDDNYFAYWKYQYNTSWIKIGFYNESETAPLYGFDKIGFSNYNSTKPCLILACSYGRYPWSYGGFLDNITGNLAVYNASGGGEHRVEGYIRTDIDNDGLIEASDYEVDNINVTLIDFNNTISVSNQTDSNGFFFFNGLEHGNYYVVTDIVSDPSNTGETASYYETFTPSVAVGSSYDYTTNLGDGRGYWRSVNGDVKMYLNTIETGLARITVKNGVGSPLSGVSITNQYKVGTQYVVNGGYCITDGSGICYLPLYSNYSSPSYQEYKLIATKGNATTIVTGIRISKDLQTLVAMTMNASQRYFIVPADSARANDFGEVSFTPDPLLVNQYIEDVYFKVWDAYENRYFSETSDGLIQDSTITIDAETFYLQREGTAFCLNYVQYPSIETCYVHYRHAGGGAYLINVSLTMPNSDITAANIVEYPSYAVMREGRKLMTAYNATHANISVEMLDDYTNTPMIDLSVPNFACTWDAGSMGEWDVYASRIVPYSGNSVSGTLYCTADNYSVFDKDTIFYLGNDTLSEVDCTINNDRVFPPTAEVPVSCIVESPLFCSQAGLKNSMAVKINRAAQGAYDSWYGLTLVGDDPNSDKMICEGGSCCNPRILFSADKVLFRSQTGLSQDAWEFLPEGTHYMDVLVNDSTSTLAPYFGAFLFTLDKTAPSTTPELMNVDIPYDILDSTMNFTCNLTYTNPQKQIQSMLIQITKVVNTLDLDSPENTVITSTIPSWYLDDQPVQDTYLFPVIYSIVSCDSTSLTCTYRGVTEQFTESTFSVKDGQDIICKASIQLKSGSTYEQEQQDSVEFKYMGAGLTDGAVNFATGILNDPYAFLLLAIVIAILMPIILILVRYVLI